MKYYIILVTIISIVLISIFYEKKIDIFTKNETIHTFIKNISNDNTVGENVQYDIGDTLEYSIIINPEDKKNITLDTQKLEENIEINEIEINGEIIDTKDLQDYNFQKETIIKITGEAIKEKQDGDNDDLITITKNTQTIEEDDNTIEEEIENIETKNITGINIEKLNYSSNIDNLIKITGENLGEIDFVNIGDASYTPELNNGELYVFVEANDFLVGEKVIFFQLKKGNLLTYEKKINFTYSDSSLVIIDINPKILKNDIDRNIILQGKGFKKMISVQLSNNLVLKDTNFNIINDNVASIIIPKNLVAGSYDINIMDTKGIFKSPVAIQITN